MYNCVKALNTDIEFNVLYIYTVYIILYNVLYSHCGFYAIENKLLLLLLYTI